MFWYLIMVIILVRLVAMLIGKVNGKFNMKGKLEAVAGFFVNNFIDSKMLFVTRFASVPSVGVITQIDATAVYAFLREKLDPQVVDVHQANMYDYDEHKTFFTVTIIELTEKRMIEMGNGYVEVLYTSAQYEWAMNLLQELAAYKIEVQQVEEKAPTVIGFARAFEMN